MKKVIFIVFSMLVCIAFSSAAYAEETSIVPNTPDNKLLGKEPESIYSSQTTIDLMEDESLFSVKGLTSEELKKINSGNRNNGLKAPFEFEIDFYDVQSLSSMVLSLSYGINVEFYNSDNKLLKSFNGDNLGAMTVTLNLENVSYIKVKTFKNIDSMDLNRFEVYGGVTYASVRNIATNVVDNGVIISWKNPTSKDLIDVLLNDESVGLSTTTKNIKNLEYNTEYNYTLTTVYEDGTRVNKEFTFKTDKYVDKKPPNEVSELSYVSTLDTVELSYKLPSDDDFNHVSIYKNGKLLKETKDVTYIDKDLIQDTVYTYKLVTVDDNGNKSEGKTISAKTKILKDDVPPDAITDLSVSSLNGGGRATWKRSNANDLDGYNLFVDGKKVNSQLIKSDSYQFTNLVNGTSYSVYVVAVDKSGNVSKPSNVVDFKPNKNAVPPVNIGGDNDSKGYSLGDVAEGTSNWFGSLWFLLAFSIGITLAFIIGQRIKHLFFV